MNRPANSNQLMTPTAVYELEAENRRYQESQKHFEVHQHSQHSQLEEQNK
jgi:hypothetical protein